MRLFLLPTISVLSQVAVVVVVMLVRHRLPRAMLILGLYFSLALVVEIVQMSLALARVDNRWTSQLFLPLEFALLLLVLYFGPGSPLFRKILLACIVLFFTLSIGSFFWSGTLMASYPYLKTVAAMIIVAASCVTLVRIIREEETAWTAEPLVWVAMANIGYFASTAVLYALSSAIARASIETMRLAWSTQAVVNILTNVVYMKGFWCLRQK